MIIPCGHRLVVRPEEIEKKTEGGLIIPETVRDMEQRGVTKGEILSIGPQAWKEFSDGKPWAEVGDKVIFARYGGLTAEDEETGEELRVLNDEDVVAIIKKG